MTTPQPAALPELPEKLIFSERLAISEAAQVPMDAECCRVIQATLDYISSNYALAALRPQPQPAAAVSDAEINRIVWEHTRLNPNQAADSGLMLCIRNAVRAILSLRPQAVPMTPAVDAERESCAATAQRYACQVGDVAWEIAAAIRARGITAQGAQGEQG